MGKISDRNRIVGEVKDAETTILPELNVKTGDLCRSKSIHACSEASLEFVKLAGLDTDEDTNVVALNLMDYFLFSPENWLPELSYCKLHAARFLFASRVTDKSNTVEQIADALGPDSSFIRLVGSPLAEDEDSATAVEYTISVAVSDVEDGYAMLYARKEILGHLLGQYVSGLENLPIPDCLNEKDHAVDEYEEENLDVWEADD